MPHDLIALKLVCCTYASVTTSRDRISLSSATTNNNHGAAITARHPSSYHRHPHRIAIASHERLHHATGTLTIPFPKPRVVATNRHASYLTPRLSAARLIHDRIDCRNQTIVRRRRVRNSKAPCHWDTHNPLSEANWSNSRAGRFRGLLS